MRFLLTLPLVALVSCGSYYSDIPNNDPSYLPAEEYVRIGRAHVKKQYPKFRLNDKKPIGLGHFKNAEPKIKRNTLGKIVNHSIHVTFLEIPPIPKKLQPPLNTRDFVITKDDVNIWLNDFVTVNLIFSKKGVITESEKKDSVFQQTSLPSQAPLSKRPKLTN